ncbi:MAG: trigger factor [Filifactoraceae bacterium]
MVELLKKESNLVSLKMVIVADEFEKYCRKAYNKNKGQFNIQGFRKGKAPRHLIEKMYGEGVFFEEAINLAFPSYFESAVKELELDVIDRPSIDVEDIEKGKDLVLTVEVAVKPDVALGQYKGLSAEKQCVEVSDDEIDKELAKKQEAGSRLISITDRGVQEKDTVILDFEGFVDGEAFSGGKAERYSLVIGSNTFIPGFEEQLIGTSIHEEKDVKVTFPTDYNSDELKGKEAIFKCMIHEIKFKELPNLDDEFAKDISEHETLDELKKEIKEKLLASKELNSENAYKNELIKTAVENASVDIPDIMVENQTDRMVQEFDSSIQQQGLDLNTYLQYTGSSLEDLKLQMKEDAYSRVKTSLVVESIAKIENIVVTESDLNEEYEKMAKVYGMEIDKVKELLGGVDSEYLTDSIKSRKAIDLIINSGILK